MSNGWAVAAVVAGVAALAWVTLCLLALRRLERGFAQRQRLWEERVAWLDEAVRRMEARLAAVPSEAAMQSAAAQGETKSVGEGDMAGEGLEGAIAPEIQAAIAAAAVASLGANARLRSARLVKPQEDVSAWSQQGRVLVQSSHNVRTRR